MAGSPSVFRPRRDPPCWGCPAAGPGTARRGRELFYRSGDAMMAISVASQPAFSAGAPRILFRGAYVAGDGLANYDVSPDGRRFLMVREGATLAPAATSLVITTLPVR